MKNCKVLFLSQISINGAVIEIHMIGQRKLWRFAHLANGLDSKKILIFMSCVSSQLMINRNMSCRFTKGL